MTFMYQKVLSLTPGALKRILSEVRPERYGDRLAPERFTLSEVIAHIADLEDAFLDRMRLAHEYPGSDAPALDPDARAEEHHYANKELYHELQVFENRRRDTLDFMANLTPEEWQRTINHPGLGVISIEQIAGMLVAHDLYHVEQACQYMS